MTDKKPDPVATGRLVDEARANGRQARLDKKPRAAPDFPARGLVTAWLKGWDSVMAPPVEHHSVPVVTQEIAISTRDARFWPEDKPLPTTYEQRPFMPCEKCRRVLTDERGRAAINSHTAEGNTHFLCKVCGHRWKLKTIRA